MAHGVQADVADGMVLSAGWLLHDEHPLTVPCAQHSSITGRRATGARGVVWLTGE